ncbi:MAG: Galactose/methyl galactoside import ATP-binding protein MglA [Anaerolineales bacterium]|nr:Galactose/methyl galactoside import ATP-binding protein MglA [Anaerolineales bacterium]
MDDQAPAVEMRGIVKRFPGVIANDHVDLDVRAGEIHALLGENGAGKSTLMNVLSGLYREDAGEIHLRGQRVEIGSPRDAINLGIGMVHQHFMLVEPMTVAENFMLGLEQLEFVPDEKQIERDIVELSKRYGLGVHPDAYIWQLSVGEQQRIEILRLLHRGAGILILDEPTAVLTPQEADELGRTLNQMAGEGKAIIFITHKLREVMAFSDRVTVLRDGENVDTLVTTETSRDELARLMVGREVLFRIEKEEREPGEVVLSVQNLEALNEKGLPALKNASFEVQAGEILGIAGVAGNGQRELAEVINGLREATSGTIRVRDQDVTNQSPGKMIAIGVSHVPEDRVGVGLVPNLPVSDNLALKGYREPPLSRGPFLVPKAIRDFAARLISLFDIATPSAETPVKLLSGGNLQKTILAREITAGRGLIVAVHPTHGLDVGATETVHQTLLEQRDEGAAILLISEDLDELLTLSDRIAVIYEGRIMGVTETDEADVEELGLMMAGELKG